MVFDAMRNFSDIHTSIVETRRSPVLAEARVR